VTLADGDDHLTVHYLRRRDGGFALGPDSDEGTALVHQWSPTDVEVEIDGLRRTVAVTRVADRIHLTGGGGGVTFTVVPRFSAPEPDLPGGAVAAPMPGKVIEIRVTPGDAVAAGDVVVVLEAMKMENHLRAAEPGTVAEVRVAVGDQVEKDVLLMVITGDEPLDDAAKTDETEETHS